MRPDDVLGSERSPESIEQIASAYRAFLDVSRDPSPNLGRLIELTLSEYFPQTALIPRETQDMSDFAVTYFDPPRIEARLDVYHAEQKGHPRAREIYGHELGHLLLHDALPKSLKDGIQERKLLSDIQRRMSVEEQADLFRLFFLLPRSIVTPMQSLAEVVCICRVPYGLALDAQARYGIRHYRKLQPYEVADLIIAEEEPF
jgi:Zn-dependent peptidase ImmA (M78 family)